MIHFSSSTSAFVLFVCCLAAVVSPSVALLVTSSRSRVTPWGGVLPSFSTTSKSVVASSSWCPPGDRFVFRRAHGRTLRMAVEVADRTAVPSAPRRRSKDETWASDNDDTTTVIPEKIQQEADRDKNLEQTRKLTLPSMDGAPGLLSAESSLSLGTGRILVMVAAALCGTNFASVKMLNEAMPVEAAAAFRFALAAIATSGVVWWQETTHPPKSMLRSPPRAVGEELVEREPFDDISDAVLESVERKEAMKAGAEVGTWYAAGYIAQAIGLLTEGASKSSFFNALAVIVVPLLDLLVKNKKLGKGSAISIALAICGVSLLELGGVSEGAAFAVSTGDMFCLAQALFFGLGYWRLESVSEKYPKQPGRITVGQLVSVAGFSALYWLVGGDMPSLEVVQGWLTDGFILSALVWTGIMSTALAMYMETMALQAVSASEMTILMTSVSLWASGFAFVTMGEVLSLQAMVGGLLILSGCVVSSMSPSTDTESDEVLSGHLSSLPTSENPLQQRVEAWQQLKRQVKGEPRNKKL